MTWVAVRIQPNKENLAQHNLEKQGYKTYCPRIMRRCRHARKVKDVLRPLFPGYLFVWLGSMQAWRPISSTFGVSHLVQFGSRPAEVPQKIIDTFQHREVDGCIPLAPVHERYKGGQDVKIVEGPFENFIARVEQCDAKERIILLLDFMNRSIKLTMPEEKIEQLA